MLSPWCKGRNSAPSLVGWQSTSTCIYSVRHRVLLCQDGEVFSLFKFSEKKTIQMKKIRKMWNCSILTAHNYMSNVQWIMTSYYWRGLNRSVFFSSTYPSTVHLLYSCNVSGPSLYPYYSACTYKSLAIQPQL